MKYIENKQEYGLEYNLKDIAKLFNKLNIPKEVYHPPLAVLEKAKYIVNLSDRSRGKTTNWLLLGMCFNSLYGTEIIYIRQSEDMTREHSLVKLFETINTYNDGLYVRILTDNKYNSVGYERGKKAFYYRVVDESGKELEKSFQYFCRVLSIDKNFDYKSSFNAPFGDFIIFDEFISKYYRINECIDFFDLLSTIIRFRKSPIVVMLSNTINRNSQYFEEFQISKEVKKMSNGEKKYITTDLGTTIYIEIIEKLESEQKKKHNKLFFGFNNPKLASITGSEAWAHEIVQHIPKEKEDCYVIAKNLYIEISTFEYLNIEVVSYNKRKCLFVHRATKLHKDSIVLSNSPIREEGFLFGLGNKKINDLIMNSLAKRQVYYSTNEVGSDFKNYVKITKQNRFDLV